MLHEKTTVVNRARIRCWLAFCVGALPVLATGLAEGAEPTPAQKMQVVMEGMNKSPQELAQICKRHGITTETYAAWKDTLVASADKVYGPAEAPGGARREAGPPVRIIGLGSEVVTERGAAPAGGRWLEAWKVHASFRAVWAQWLEKDAFTEYRHARAGTVLGSLAVAFSRGDDAIAISFLAPFYRFEDTSSWDGVNARYKTEYYYLDVRWHRTLDDHLSAFLGYKVGITTFDYREREGAGRETEEGCDVGHGPILGFNAVYPLKGTPLSLYGSFAAMPIGAIHDDRDGNVNGARWGSDSCMAGWFANPEFGIRWAIAPNASLSLSWLWHIWGTYSQGPVGMMHGPAASFSYRF